MAFAYVPKGDKTYPRKDYHGIYPEYPKVTVPAGGNAKLIKRGEYLAKVGDCISCHTNSKTNGKPFAGGLPIKTPFGTFYSPNITPDKKTGIGKWVFKDFVRAMHQGKAPNGSYYFPVFPYVYFNHITKQDLRALWAYLQALPPVDKKNKGNTLPFPLNVRFSQLGWRILFFYGHRGQIKYDASRTAKWNRGKYLVNGLGHCSMCHTPLNPFGAPKRKYFLTGGFVDDFWAPNITAYGLKTATDKDVVKVFKKMS